MSLSWSVLALSLIGAQDQQPSQPKSPSSACAVQIDLCAPRLIGSEACRKAAAAIVGQAPAVAEPDCPKPGVLAKVADLCAERLVTYLLDEAKDAACAKIAEATGCDAKTPPGIPLEDKTTVPAKLLSSTLEMQLPRVKKPRTMDEAEAPECWPMTLPDAIRIALDNNEVVRVIAFGARGIPIGGFEPTPLKTETSTKATDANPAPIVIARLNADAPVWRFKAEIMAEVRSVEQQYWNLAQAHVQLWAADRAVTLAQEINDREQAELQVGRGTVADVAEAAQRLEQFKLDLVTRTSDVITTERQLRNLLGLPPADNRRITPITPPVEEPVEFDWDTCLHEMMDEQPDIVQQTLLVRVAELQLLIARNQLVPELSLTTVDQINGLGQQLDSPSAVMVSRALKMLEQFAQTTGKVACSDANAGKEVEFPKWQSGGTFQTPLSTGRSPLANTRQAQYALLRSRAYLQQVCHQTTHTLARFFLEVDANYKQYRTASRLRKAAAQRLDAQRAYYEEGRVTIDRFLDAVSQYATAVATEAQYNSTYNIALAALAETKGTLLTDRGIVIAEGPHPRKAYVQATQPRPSVPTPADAPAKAAIPSTPAKPTPPRWTEVIQVTRRAGKRDLRTMTASFDPERFSGLEVPRIIAINDIPPAPRCLVMPDLAAILWPPAPCCATETATTDVTSKSQAACTGSTCATATGIAKTDSAFTTAKAEHSAKPQTWTFSISIGGANPLQIKGTITRTETDDSAPARP